jgi:hypothetical protein
MVYTQWGWPCPRSAGAGRTAAKINLTGWSLFINALFLLINLHEQNMNKPIKYQRKKVDRPFIE